MEDIKNIKLSADDFEVIGKNIEESQKVVRPSISFLKDAWRRFKMNKVAMLGLALLCLSVFMAVFGPFMTKFKPNDQDYVGTYLGPLKGGHIFGTDSLGRDLFTRIWHGARISLLIGVICAILDIFLGALYGGISGYLGGKVDTIMMRIVDILVSIPYMLVVIIFTVAFTPGITTIILAMVVTSWASTARLVRGQVLQLREQEFVLAAQVLGATPLRIIVKHMIPNILGVIVVQLTLDVPGMIFGEAFLSMLGLGVPAPQSSLGSLISEGYTDILQYPYLLIVPAVVLVVMMLSFNFMTDGLRDALDPKMRK